MDSNNVAVTFSWTGPSIRNGSYNYYVTFNGEQVDDYPQRRRRNHPNTAVVLDGNNTSLPITGLPYANYTINVTAFNVKKRRSGPSTIQSARSINIGKKIMCKHIIWSSGNPLLIRFSKIITQCHLCCLLL